MTRAVVIKMAGDPAMAEQMAGALARTVGKQQNDRVERLERDLEKKREEARRMREEAFSLKMQMIAEDKDPWWKSMGVLLAFCILFPWIRKGA